MEQTSHVMSTSASITVIWKGEFAKKIAAPDTINSYATKFRVLDSREKLDRIDVPIRTEDEYVVEITDLKPSTSYELIVYWCNEDDENTSLFKKICKTGESKVNFLKENAYADKTKETVIYHLKPVSKIEHQIQVKIGDGTRHYADTVRILDMIAERKANIHSSEEKSILLLGGTGTGKSTMIDALMNFIAEVSYKDDLRFGLICKTLEEKIREDKQFQSQTSSVTVYRIPRMKGLKVSCGVNIIDTPGFMDTRKDFDKRITAQIKELFEKGINHLDAILVVLPLSTKRLTEGQKHIFSSILDMFGDDIRDNIFVTLTHDDSGDVQQCLTLLDEAQVPYKEYYRFNNANIFSKSKTSEEQISLEFWKMRTKNFAMLFKKLETTRRTTIKSSIAVMHARTMLEIQLKDLEDVLSQQAQYIVNYKEDKKVIEAIEKEDAICRKHSKYSRVVQETKEQNIYRESLNCPKCRKTCHKNCWVPVKKLGWTCEVMMNGKCTVCDEKCNAEDHELSRKIFKVQYVKTWFSGEDVILRHAKREEIFNRFQNTIDRIDKCIADINNTAIKKDALSTTEYIEHITKKEKKKRREGYEMRIQIHTNILKHLRQPSTSKLSMDYLLEN